MDKIVSLGEELNNEELVTILDDALAWMEMLDYRAYEKAVRQIRIVRNCLAERGKNLTC